MSSTLSMANQKLKQFFGASQTKNFNLQSDKDNYELGSSKLNNFLDALKQYSTLFQALPRALEKVYITFGYLSPKMIYFDSAEYRSSYYKIIEDAKTKANSIYDRYFFFARQLSIEEEQIKKLEKEFEVIRQRYDHYKSKVDKLTKQFATIENNPKAYKQAKQQVDRVNIGKLTNSQAEYNKELVKMRAKLQNYHINFSDMAFNCYELSQFSDEFVNFLITNAKQAQLIKQFIDGQRGQQRRKNIAHNNQVAIETLFTKHKMDFFPQIQNQFITNPKQAISAKKQTILKGDQNVKIQTNNNQQTKSIKLAFDEFNFFKDSKKIQLSIASVQPHESKLTNQSTDLLGIM